MSLDAIRAQLARLKVHAVNLAVTAGVEPLVELQGSLLQYWKLPRSLNGSWLLTQLQAMPDNAGPETVMNALQTAHGALPLSVGAGTAAAQRQLFER